MGVLRRTCFGIFEFSDSPVTVCNILEHGRHLEVVLVEFWSLAALSISRKQWSEHPLACPLFSTASERLSVHRSKSCSCPIERPYSIGNMCLLHHMRCSSSSRYDSLSKPWRPSSVGHLNVSYSFLIGYEPLDVLAHCSGATTRGLYHKREPLLAHSSAGPARLFSVYNYLQQPPFERTLLLVNASGVRFFFIVLTN